MTSVAWPCAMRSASTTRGISSTEKSRPRRRGTTAPDFQGGRPIRVPRQRLPCDRQAVSEPSAPLASTPEPPYVAAIFTSVRTPGDSGYAAMAESMAELAAAQPGYLGMESAREGVGITVSYWRDEAAARGWKQVADHRVAQRLGRDVWYSDYRVRIAHVVREYGPATSALE
jgi:heme-degrading monooxygenase HmoA